MHQFCSFLYCSLLSAAPSSRPLIGQSLTRARLMWMVLSTAFNLILWTWVVVAAAQTNLSEAAVNTGLEQPAAVSGWVEQYMVVDGFPKQGVLHIHGSAVVNLQNRSQVVIGLPAQSIVLQLQGAPTVGDLAVPASADVSLHLVAGKNHAIEATYSPGHTPNLEGRPLTVVRPELLHTAWAVPAPSRHVQASICSEAPAVDVGFQLINAGVGLGHSSKQ